MGLREDRDGRAPLALRLGLGATFAMVGWDHVFVGHAVITSALGFLPDPELAASVLSALELAAGVLLLLGVALPPALAVAVVVLTGALATYAARGTLLYADVAALGAAVALLATGPGPWSLDGRLARLPAWLRRPPLAAQERRAWLALRGLAGLSPLLGAALAFGPGLGGYEVIDARLPFAGAPLAALAGAAAGALLLLGLAPRAALALVLALEALAFAAFGLRGGFTSYLAFQVPLVAAAAALWLRPDAPAPAAWLDAVAARRGRADARPLAWAAAALLVLAAVVAGAGPPPGPGALQPASTLYTTRTLALGDGEARLQEGQAWVGQVPVRSLALRDVVATLTWEDDAPGTAPDEFTLELVPPAGMLAGPAAEGAGGLLEVRVPVYRSPPERAELGVGPWNVRVYLRDAGDASTAGVLPGLPDGGNGFRLAVTATVFEPA